MMMLTLVISFSAIFTVTTGRILVYNTENGEEVEKVDCIYHVYDNGEEIPYCRRDGKGLTVNRSMDICYNDGEKFSFRSLILQKILPSELLDWNSSIEMVDLYARYFYNRSSFEEADDHYLCKCVKIGTFGKYCEYQLTHNAELFSDAIKTQFNQKRSGSSWNTQRYGDILCYTTLQCNSGLMCLDWRDINDGIQQCAGGSDEDNWDKLEFNECEDNEFRCSNGMCIPEEFWLDGQVDCMDWSDELDQGSGQTCFFSSNAIECDEHICPHHSYSCGDGQCINWMARMAFKRFETTQGDCFNKRNLNYMCEVSSGQHAWTSPNGLCIPDEGYDDPQYPSSKMTIEEQCQYLLRCALSNGFERDCPCNFVNCTQVMRNICPNNSMIMYPQSKLINPNVLFYYTYNQVDTEPTIAYLSVHGNQRCRGYEYKIDNPITIPYSFQFITYSIINNIVCALAEQSVGYKDFSSKLQYDKFCYNTSFTFNGRPYAVNPDVCSRIGECISQYRIHDGFPDCSSGEDENQNFDKDYCTGKVGQHRFQCYNNEHKCLPLSRLGTLTKECSNNYDERLFGSGPSLRESIKCQKRNTVDCNRLKEYINQSFVKNSNSFMRSERRTSINAIPFRSYCDSFWDLHNHIDEATSSCQRWICQNHQYQCRSGHCIEFDWLCDGEWDCPDASDEEAAFLIEHLTVHNKRLVNITAKLQQCRKRYSNSPFSSICNVSSEFGCYRSQVLDPLDIAQSRPCIKLTQIGDGLEDCYNAYDEKNTFETYPSSNSMLGFQLRCGNHYKPYATACLPDAKDNCTKILCLNHRNEDGLCSGIYDAMCLNGNCVKNGRCNGLWDCMDGEDEYWCPPHTSSNQLEYRYNKKKIHRPSNFDHMPQFPYHNVLNIRRPDLSHPIVNSQNDQSPIMLSYTCNRGVAVLAWDGTIVCFCPPAYYGRKCQFFSDRISIIAHFNQTILLMKTLKIKATLVFQDVSIDHHEFIVTPTIENLTKIKHKFYLLYSRSVQMLTHKKMRYFNQTDIMNNHPYSIHFDVFSLENDNHIIELGSWHYPINFDYLPAYRLAVVLKFPSWFLNKTIDPCSRNSCNQNSICMPIFNQNNSYYCSCKNGFYGKNCELRDHRCETYCYANALCQHSSTQMQPICICPLNHYGPRCNLKHSDCYSNPCFNSGTCISTNDQSGEATYICHCSKRFYGDHCQYEMGSVHVQLNMTNALNIRASVIQFYDIMTSSFQLILQHQQLYQSMPSKITYYHSSIYPPTLGVLKVYKNLTDPEYYIMYSFIQKSLINITSVPQYCPHTSLLLSNDNKSYPDIFVYHYLCRNNSQLLCFHDKNYLCLCEANHYRAECFGYDTQINHCNYCLSNGTCIRGDLNNHTDFICICPGSHYGNLCQFSSVTDLSRINSTTYTKPAPNNSSKATLTIYNLLFIFGILYNLYLFIRF